MFTLTYQNKLDWNDLRIGIAIWLFPVTLLLAMPSNADEFGFTGQRYESETGLLYLRARYYDPDSGRFLTKDPLGIAAGPNAYIYVKNSPPNLVDPLGLDTYELNIQLGIEEGKPVPIDQTGSHTLQCTTDVYGNLEHTYSWAADGGIASFYKEFNWNIDHARDTAAAKLDIAQNHLDSRLVSIGPYYDNALDVEVRGRRDSGVDVHHWLPWNMCKTELNEVDDSLSSIIDIMTGNAFWDVNEFTGISGSEINQVQNVGGGLNKTKEEVCYAI